MTVLTAMLVALQAAPAASANDELPLIVAARTAVPPAIDGALDDEAWDSAAEATGFLLNTRPVFAQEQTWVRLCYDDRALYIAFRCAESKLLAASQQSHLFRARETGRDANVFADDCVEVFVGPPGSGTYYHFAANAAGGSYEAREMDSKWGCEWEWAAAVGEGEWTVEIRIPFEAFGLGAPSPAGEWALNLAREQQPLGENSTWSGLQGRFHSPDQFGQVRLADGPALRVIGLPGRSRPLRLRAERLAEPVQVALDVDGPAGAGAAAEATLVEGDAEVALRLPPTAEAGPDSRLRWSVLRKASAALVYRSPWVGIGAGARELTLIIRARNADVAVMLNGEPVNGDRRGRYSLGLGGGINTLGVECKGRPGTWSLTVQRWLDGGATPFANGWRTRSDPPEDWALPDADVSRWRLARSDGSLLLPRRPCERAAFHRQVYVREEPELFWPMQRDIHLPRRSRQRIYPLLAEAGRHACPDFTYTLDLPRPLRVVATDGTHGSPVSIEAAPRVERRGRLYNRYAIRPDGPVGGGFQLLAHWRSADGDRHYYHPVLDLGGTFDWQAFEGVVRAPEYAAECGVLLLKWQQQDITGEIWFDDVTMRAQGEGANLVSAGTFDEPQWDGKPFIGEYTRDGKPDRGVHILARPEDVDRQQGVWVTEPHVGVEPGREYVFTVRASAANVRAPRRQPRACLLIDTGAPQADELVGYISWQAHGGHVLGLEEAFPIRVLSELPGKRPQDTRFIACYYGDRLQDEACNRALAQTTALSGINSIYGSADTAVARYWPGGELPEFILPINWHDYHAQPVAPDFLEQHPDLAATKKDGARSERSICPIVLLDHPNDFLPRMHQWLEETVSGSPYRHLDWDHETPVWRDDSICFDERCLNAFREWASLPGDAELDREAVIANHKDEWIRFRCHLNARMAGLIGKMLRAIDPKCLYSVYSGFQSPRTHEVYGVDWEMMAPHLDLGIAGYNGGRTVLGETVGALGAVPFIGGEMYHENDRSAQYPLPTPRKWRLRLLRTVLNGGGNGVLVWWLPVLDGGGFWGIGQVAALVADFERFFTEFDRQDQLARCEPELGPDGLAVLVHGDERLIICMNGSAQSTELRLANRDLPPKSNARSWPDGQAERSARVLRARLEPDDVKVWWIGPDTIRASQ